MPCEVATRSWGAKGLLVASAHRKDAASLRADAGDISCQNTAPMHFIQHVGRCAFFPKQPPMH
eukprot:11226129-Lingulodinium_polyedra.AAC.1